MPLYGSIFIQIASYIANAFLCYNFFAVSLPRITRQPDDVNVTTLCNSASFVCTAHGSGLRKIVWKRVNYTLPVTADVTEEKSFNELSSTLTISEIFGYYSGQYYCIVENEAEKVTSRIVNLCVKTSKVIITY